MEAAVKDYKSRHSIIKRPHLTKEFTSHSPNEELANPVVAEQRQQSQNDIPSLPQLSANSIDAVERGGSPLSPMAGCGQVLQNDGPLLYSTSFNPIMSQRSHLSQIRPSFGTDVSSTNYAKFLDEYDNVPLLGTETAAKSDWLELEK